MTKSSKLKQRPSVEIQKPPVQINVQVKKRGIIRSAGRLMFNTEWRRWLGTRDVRTFWGFLVGMFKDLASLDQVESKREETFDQALKRLRLTEQDLKDRSKTAKFFVAFYLFLAALLFIYTIYMATVKHFIIATFVCAVLCFMSLAFAFREHFWLTQIKHRKLGLTWEEWKKSVGFKNKTKWL